MYTPGYSTSPWAKLEEWCAELDTLRGLKIEEENNLKKSLENLGKIETREKDLQRMSDTLTTLGLSNSHIGLEVEAMKKEQVTLKNDILSDIKECKKINIDIENQEKSLMGQIQARYPNLSENDIDEARLTKHSYDMLLQMIQQKAEAAKNAVEADGDNKPSQIKKKS